MQLLEDDPAGDWTAPGVYQVGAGLYRIPLPLPQDGLRAVNVYAVRDGDGLVLVDSGWALAEARERLEQAVKLLDCSLASVRRFLVTHVHRDHYTLAVTLRREFGMRISLGRDEAGRSAWRRTRRGTMGRAAHPASPGRRRRPGARAPGRAVASRRGRLGRPG